MIKFGPVVKWIWHRPSKPYGGGSNPSGTAISTKMIEDTQTIYRIFDSPEFNKEFWDWFDVLSKKEKNVFHYYKEDMAKLFFYNKYYRQRLVTRNEESGYLTIRT